MSIITHTTAEGLAVVTGMGWRYFRRARSGPRGGRGWEYQVAASLTQEQPDTALPWWPKLAQAFDHRPPSTDPPREVPDQVRLVLELLAWRDSPLTPPPQ